VSVDIARRLPLLDGAKNVRLVGPLEQLVGDAAGLAARLAGEVCEQGTSRDGMLGADDDRSHDMNHRSLLGRSGQNRPHRPMMPHTG